MTPNAPCLINPRLVKPMQFSAAMPSEALVGAVKRFIDDTADGGDWDAAGGGVLWVVEGVRREDEKEEGNQSGSVGEGKL